MSSGAGPAAVEGSARLRGQLPVESLSALGDPIRWRTVELLASGEQCVCDLTDRLGLAQSRLSYHLGVLRDAGLIVPRQEGRWVYYSLAPEALDSLADRLAGLARGWRREGAQEPASRCR